MKTKSTLLTLMLIAFESINSFAQIPNSGFENWTSMGNYMEPNGWETANDCASTFFTITRDSSHHPPLEGSYSIRIESKPSMLPNYCEALGLAMSGDTLSNPSPSFAITGHPTSLTGYYKYAPQNGDTMLILVVLFQNGSEVSSGAFTSTSSVSSWTSFNIPFSTYTVADSGHIILASYYCVGPPPAVVPNGNSVLNIDNLNFDNLITTGINELNGIGLISAYPNPTEQYVTVASTKEEDMQVHLFDANGKAILVSSVFHQKITIDMQTLSAGSYIMRISTKAGIPLHSYTVIKKSTY